MDRSLPVDAFALNPSPLFRWGARRIQWLHRRPQPFSTYRRRATLIIVALSLCLTVALYLAFRAPYWLAGEGMLGAGAILTISSVVLGTIFDLLPIASVTRYYKRDTIHHDLLRITPLSIHDNIAAYHELARIDSWRTVTSLGIIRLVGMLLLLGGTVANYVDNVIAYPAGYSGPYTVSALATMACFGAVSFIIALEPHWRVRAMTALALALAIRMQQEWTRLFMNIVLVIAHWLIFSLYLGVVVFFMVCISNIEPEAFAVRFIVIPIALYVGLRGWYAFITIRCLSYAKWRMFRQQLEA